MITSFFKSLIFFASLQDGGRGGQIILTQTVRRLSYADDNNNTHTHTHARTVTQSHIILALV